MISWDSLNFNTYVICKIHLECVWNSSLRNYNEHVHYLGNPVPSMEVLPERGIANAGGVRGIETFK